ncbi:uncharacterized protein LOC143294360 isoform X2 [Babylonia areolata]|uniref:uncharacterized protein LOC143294360 isoform X2 n=1 Tax=Babylonia areolata TaxID=304850 RepID=UPI003FCFFC71
MTSHRRHDSQRLVSVMSLLLVTSAVSLLPCMATRSSSFNPKRKSRVQPPVDIIPRYNQILQVQRLKDKILRRLNLTTVPEPPSKKTQQKAINSILNRLPPPRNRTRVTSPLPDTIVWSEPVASKAKVDQLLFRVGSLKEKSYIINRVTLLLRLRYKRKGKNKKVKGKKKTKGKGDKARQAKKPVAQNGRQKRSSRKTSGSKRKKKKSGSRLRKRSRRVKLLTQAQKSGKFRRVVVQRVTVSKKFTWIKIPIPVSLVSRAAQSDNQSLVLRVRCRRCLKIGVSIDNALSRKKKRKADHDSSVALDLNPNRPFMLIRTADTPLTTQSPPTPILPRSARHVDRICPSQSQPRFSCCSEKMEVTFKAIGWDHWIVHPHGFTTVVCGVCQNSTKNQNTLRNERESPQSGKTQRQKTENKVFQRQKYGNETAANKDSNYRFTDWKKAGLCQPRDLSPLTVMYYADRNTLIRATIPQLIAKHCDCTPPD